jgi:hypothetical protein
LLVRTAYLAILALARVATTAEMTAVIASRRVYQECRSGVVYPDTKHKVRLPSRTAAAWSRLVECTGPAKPAWFVLPASTKRNKNIDICIATNRIYIEQIDRCRYR